MMMLLIKFQKQSHIFTACNALSFRLLHHLAGERWNGNSAKGNITDVFPHRIEVPQFLLDQRFSVCSVALDNCQSFEMVGFSYFASILIFLGGVQFYQGRQSPVQEVIHPERARLTVPCC